MTKEIGIWKVDPIVEQMITHPHVNVDAKGLIRRYALLAGVDEAVGIDEPFTDEEREIVETIGTGGELFDNIAQVRMELLEKYILQLCNELTRQKRTIEQMRDTAMALLGGGK